MIQSTSGNWGFSFLKIYAPQASAAAVTVQK
jgi:hypothetical protein